MTTSSSQQGIGDQLEMPRTTTASFLPQQTVKRARSYRAVSIYVVCRLGVARRK